MITSPDERVRVEIQTALDDLVSSGAEIGVQDAVIKHGRVVSTFAAMASFPTATMPTRSDALTSDSQRSSSPGVAVAVMRNRFAAELTTIARIDQLVADTLSSGHSSDCKTERRTRDARASD